MTNSGVDSPLRCKLQAKTLVIEVRGAELTLGAEKCLWWKKYQSLFIADVHFGKSNHFRKAGIGVPLQLTREEVLRLQAVVDKYQPQKLVFLGDLFHSEYNRSVEVFSKWLDGLGGIETILVKGNHDIMLDEVYDTLGLEQVEVLQQDGLLFSHDAIKGTGYYNIYGHVHPGVRLYGKGRQSQRFPCFHWKEDEAVMPAFGLFTGHVSVKVQAGDRVFLIAGNEVVEARAAEE
ncbi:MAG: ligase-associated DNA damage response endonuclease PdeM [Saprospiraceae bacterium]|nr:ligase-associated DNA damage response endonuclease PdeM [Saprospiraceae bacterium]